ncbi:hypothetical protein ACFFRR_006498 [Megaselia abdita]
MALTRKRKFYEWFNLMAITWIFMTELLLLTAYCLKDLKIFVPEAVINGNAATLSCQYDLEQAALYSVRWYFQGEEFYRFVPKESPPTFEFPVSGIHVDLTKSDGTQVTLRAVNRMLSGNYQCEVSEDAPLFHTELRTAHMQVIELPQTEPVMSVNKKMIGLNDEFKAECSVAESFPPANITWIINGRRVYKSRHQRISYETYSASSTISTLEMDPHSQVLQGLFHAIPKYTSTLTLLCEVSILHVYHKTATQRILLSMSPPTTNSPNLLESKRNGDPDALTSSTNRTHLIYSGSSSILIILFVSLYKMIAL